MIDHFLRVAKPESTGHRAQGFFLGQSDVPVSNNETYRNLLTYAIAIAGSERILAERLGVKVRQILNWTMGIAPVPTDIFLKAVDVVLASTAEDIRRSRETLNRLTYPRIQAANQSQLLDCDPSLDISAHPGAQGEPKSLPGKSDS